MNLLDPSTPMTCPYCQAPLDVEPLAASDDDHGTAHCDCYTYPVVDGILVAQQLSDRPDTVDPAVEMLRRGDVDGARRFLRRRTTMIAGLGAPRRFDRVASAIGRLVGTAVTAVDGRRRDALGPGPSAGDPAPFRAALESTRPGPFASYLFHRYANPSFAAAMPTITALNPVAERPDRPMRILDLACGIGHSTFALATRFPDAEIVAVDPDFANLELLRRHLAPGAVCVCANAELPLPFSDDVFDAVFCLDAFHYIRSKWALARELDRTTTDDGVLVFPHLHNALVETFTPGIPLAPAAYVRMFDTTDARLFGEADILDRAVRDRTLDLTADVEPELLASTPDLTLVASRRDDVFVVHRLQYESIPSSTIGINPIYHGVLDGSSLELTMDWPDETLEQECADIRRHLPARASIDIDMLTRSVAGTTTDADDREIADLRATMILVDLAAGYERLEATLRRYASA